MRRSDIPTEYLRITDTLDMVGVELCCSWAKTRQTNEITLQNKVNISLEDSDIITLQENQLYSKLLIYLSTFPI